MAVPTEENVLLNQTLCMYGDRVEIGEAARRCARGQYSQKNLTWP